MLGKTGNLTLTQPLLGSSDIKSMVRSAHPLDADLRAALSDRRREGGRFPAHVEVRQMSRSARMLWAFKG
jgi:hypothetical protein